MNNELSDKDNSMEWSSIIDSANLLVTTENPSTEFLDDQKTLQ